MSHSYRRPWFDRYRERKKLRKIPLASKAPAPAFLDQQHFRFREDDGNETTATWRAALDTNVSVPRQRAIRLRIACKNTGGLSVPSRQYKLQFSRNAGTWTDVGQPHTTAEVRGYSQFFSAATQQITSGAFAGGSLREGDALNPIAPVAIAAGASLEMEFALHIYTASVSDTFDFRVVTSTGALLDSYDLIPTATVTARETAMYLHAATSPDTGTLPGGSSLNGTADVQDTNATVNRDMNDTAGASEMNIELTPPALGDAWYARFISRPLDTQTIPSGTWFLPVKIGGAQGGSAFFINLWHYRPSTGSTITTFGPGEDARISVDHEALVLRAAPSASVQAGDILVLEVWANGFDGEPYDLFFDGTTEDNIASYAAYLLAPTTLTFQVLAPKPAIVFPRRIIRQVYVRA